MCSTQAKMSILILLLLLLTVAEALIGSSVVRFRTFVLNRGSSTDGAHVDTPRTKVLSLQFEVALQEDPAAYEGLVKEKFLTLVGESGNILKWFISEASAGGSATIELFYATDAD